MSMLKPCGLNRVKSVCTITLIHIHSLLDRDNASGVAKKNPCCGVIQSGIIIVRLNALMQDNIRPLC